VAERHGKVAGFIATDEAWAQDYIGHGFRMMPYGLDSLLCQRALSQGLRAMRRRSPGDAQQSPATLGWLTS
jgi:2-keto-3-deoxy-L-rhamnonate aldolase RhmA